MGFAADTLHDRVAIVFAASDQANFMTGETIYVSGGPSVGNREN